MEWTDKHAALPRNLMVARQQLREDKYLHWAQDFSSGDLHSLLAAAGEFGARVTPGIAGRLCIAGGKRDMFVTRAAAGLAAVSQFVRVGPCDPSDPLLWAAVEGCPGPPAELLAFVADWSEAYYADLQQELEAHMRRASVGTVRPHPQVQASEPDARGPGIPPAPAEPAAGAADKERRYVLVQRERLEAGTHTKWAARLWGSELCNFLRGVGEFRARGPGYAAARLLIVQAQERADVGLARAAAGLRVITSGGAFDKYLEEAMRCRRSSPPVAALVSTWLDEAWAMGPMIDIELTLLPAISSESSPIVFSAGSWLLQETAAIVMDHPGPEKGVLTNGKVRLVGEDYVLQRGEILIEDHVVVRCQTDAKVWQGETARLKLELWPPEEHYKTVQSGATFTLRRDESTVGYGRVLSRSAS